MDSCYNCRKRFKCSRAFDARWCTLHSSEELRRCKRCGKTYGVEEHHIFGGANRKRSDRDGLTIDLCGHCHRTSKDSAHASGEYTCYLHKLGQTVYEDYYGEGSFLPEYGRNYL